MEYKSVNHPDTLQHLKRHFSDSKTVGSKFNLPKEAIAGLLEVVDKQLMDIFFANNEEPGRIELQIKHDKVVGTNALIELHDFKDEHFTVTRDLNTEHTSEVEVVLASKDKIPTTNIVTVIAGPYGDSGEWGIYTLFPGEDAGMPFPNESQPDNLREKCQQYWDSHGFLATPGEIQQIIDDERQHMDQLNEQIAKTVHSAFNNGRPINHYPEWLKEANTRYNEHVSPIIERFEHYVQSDGLDNN